MVHPVAQTPQPEIRAWGLDFPIQRKSRKHSRVSAAKRTASQLQCNPNKPAKPGDPRKMAKQWCLSRDILGIQRKTFKSQPKSAQAISILGFKITTQENCRRHKSRFCPGILYGNPAKPGDPRKVAKQRCLAGDILDIQRKAFKSEPKSAQVIFHPRFQDYNPEKSQETQDLAPRETEPKQAIDPEWPSGCPRKVPHTAVGEVKSDLLLTEQSRVFYNTPVIARTDLIVKVPDTDYVGAAYWNLKERKESETVPSMFPREQSSVGQFVVLPTPVPIDPNSVWRYIVPSNHQLQPLRTGFGWCPNSSQHRGQVEDSTFCQQRPLGHWTTSTPDTQQPALGVERESVTARIAHDQVSRIQEEDVANWASIYKPSERNPLRVARIGASGSRIGVGVASQEPERKNPTQGLSKQGSDWIQDQRVPEGSSGEPVSVQPCQGTSVMISSPWQETESRGSGIAERKGSEGKTRTTRWGQEHSRLKSKNQAIQPKYGL
ncbi:hypothetical protein B0H14DRAFT_2637488 [Mycena olivaceomarginata]|nr:hypothetical protein B0H14DRAFT_2637488 [Mycena olivaceomarginata]